MREGSSDPGAVVVDTSSSRHASLSPVPLSSVRLVDGFWARRRDLNRTTTLPAQYEQLELTGRLDNFRRAAGALDGSFQGLYFNDSDVYKWLEAASWTLADASQAAQNDDTDLATMTDTVIELIAAAQEDSGYLNTYYSAERADERWSNLRDMHELYCAGHLIQAAVAYVRATGDPRLMKVARRFADLICDRIGPGEGQQPGAAGHPEIEMALVELARATGEQRYLEHAAYLIDARGKGLIGGRAYHQDHAPFRELDQLAGHAVRAVYLTAGATDLYAETGDGALYEALIRLWERMRRTQMYITGGIGGRHQGEAIGADFELPNARAYAETCAGIANTMWAWRMLQLEGNPEYADVMERALYNAVLPGISLAGDAYFYVNPLASDGVPEPGGEVYHRQAWFTCACCPPNIARTIAALPGMLYSTAGEKIWVHHYVASEAEIALSGGQKVRLIQRTRYPWDGQIVIDVLTAGNYEVAVRIPSWCAVKEEKYRPTVAVNGGACPGDVAPGQYVTIERSWAVGDTICIQLPMPVQAVRSHPHMLENTGRIALMRGPLLYCIEAVDHPGVADLRDIRLDREAELRSSYRPDLLGGVQVIEAEAAVDHLHALWTEHAYLEQPPEAATVAPVRLLAIPYFAWANRDVGAMQVWLKQA